MENTLKTPLDMLDYLISCYLEESDLDIDLVKNSIEGYEYSLILKGDSWEGYNDERVSRIVLGVYDTVVSYCTEHLGYDKNSDELNDFHVHILTENNCTKVSIKNVLNFVRKGLKEYNSDVGRLIHMGLFVAMVLGGGAIVANYLYYTQKLNFDDKQKERQALIEVINKARIDNILIDKQTAVIKKEMNSNDIAYFPAVNKEYSKKTISGNIEDGPEHASEIVKCRIISITDYADDTHKASVDLNGYRRTCTVFLSNMGVEELRSAMKAEEEITLKLEYQIKTGKKSNFKILEIL
jgi:hypothetical protein